jgi:hypothetical protein
MNNRREINKVVYNNKCSRNRKYVRLFFIASIILLLSNFMLDFNMSAKLKQSSSRSEANAFQVNTAKATTENRVQMIRIIADNNGYTPNTIYVQRDIPVKLIIEGKQLNSCNNEVVVPSFNIVKTLKSGENIIEFTPKDQDINFSCWMGMIRGVIKVTDNIDSI